MGAIGNVIVGMLQDAGIIGTGFEVVEFDLWELKIRDNLDVFYIGMPRTGVPDAVLLHFTENLEVFSRYRLPNRFTTEYIGFFAYGVPFDIVFQKFDNLFR